MLVSRKWLQDFFESELPSAQELADTIALHAFEIDGVEQVGDDWVLDVDVLPSRADALSHRGMARELAAILELPLKRDPLREDFKLEPTTDTLSVTIEDELRCPRYTAAVIKGVKIGPSPEWLAQRLEAVGERSINNAVDVTNYVMHMLGQPLHVFDAHKIANNTIIVRPAKDGETFTALGGTEHTFVQESTVIGDGAGNALAAGGVKGGVIAEVDENTVDIIIESANFNPVLTRKSSKALNLHTSAAKMFQHGLPVELPAFGVHEAVQLMLELTGGELVGYVDVGTKTKEPHYAGVSTREVNELLGTQYTDDDVRGVFKRLGFVHMQTNPLEQVYAQAREYVGKEDAAKIVCLPDDDCACESLVCRLYARAGVNLPSAIADQFMWGDPISKEDAVPGDLVFATGGDAHAQLKTTQFARGTVVSEHVNHVGVYLDEGLVAHASEEKGVIAVEPIEEAEEFSKGVLYRRMVPKDEKRFAVEAPFERSDIRIQADLIEEVARIMGLVNIEPQPLPERALTSEVDATYAATEAVRSALTNAGFIELYTYSLTDEGTVAPVNSLVRGRDHMRENITRGVTKAIEKNIPNMPLVGLSDIRVFEIGNVFTPDKETMHVCIAAHVPGKKGAAQATAYVEGALTAVAEALGLDRTRLPAAAETVEFDLNKLVPDAQLHNVELPYVVQGTTFAAISPYPFIARDIAAWMPEDTALADVEALLREHGTKLLRRIDQFDEFTKDGRTSRAFRLIFQSFEKTLTDAEVNDIMQKITDAYAQKGWEVR